MVTELGERLRRERAAAGLTQEELAERSGVSSRTISDTERGLRSTIYKDTARRLAGALGLDAEVFVAAARGVARAPSVPVPPTTVIGREREIAAVVDALRGARLVTLTGAGGIGKTRIAIEVARAARDAIFVPLGSLEDASLVGATVAHAIGAVATGGPPLDAIATQLAARRVLLVLDTFEHLVDGASFVAELLDRCPNVSVLATSRERLSLRGEHELGVPPLDPSRAAALFEARAREPSDDVLFDAAVVTDICDRLDGLPLAIELAAARLKHLSLDALRDVLDHRLAVLKGGARDLPSRQRTMRDTVAWSFELLAPSERALLIALSVFIGGWTLDATRAVAMQNDVLDDLSALVDKSLVLLESNGRYRMLDVIREFAQEQGSGDADAHAQYFVRSAESAETHFGLADQDDWYDRMEAQHDNIRAALRFAIDGGDAKTAQRLTGALWQFWRAHGHTSEGRMWLAESLALPSDDEARAKAMWGAAWLAYHQDDYVTADALSVELLALGRRTGNATDTRNGLTLRGMVAMAQARYAEAAMSFEEALELCRPQGRAWLVATSYLNLATAVMHAGDIDRAADLFADALALYVDLGDHRFATRVQMHLAQVAMLRGDEDEAQRSAVAVLSAAADLGDEQSIADALETLAAVHAEQRPLDAAFAAGAAASMRESMPIHPLPFDRALVGRRLTRARSSTNAEHWDDAFAEGRAVALDRAIARLLE